MSMFALLWRSVVAVFLTLALAACQNLKPYEGADRGWLVMSIAAPHGAQYGSFRAHFRRVGGAPDEAQWFQWTRMNELGGESGEFNSEGRVGHVGVTSLQPGRYELFDISTSAGHGNLVQIFYDSRPLSIPFTIKSGETVYLGEFLTVQTWGEKFLVLDTPGPPYYLLSNKQTRDIPLAKAKTPEMAATVRNAVINADKMGFRFVRSTLRPQQ